METDRDPARLYKNNEKIFKVLKKFLEPDFKVRNDVYLNLFLTHLVGKEGRKNIDNECKDRFSEWLTEASILWDQGNVTPPSVILSFALNLASHLSLDEQLFVKLNSQNVYESYVGIAQKNANNSASVTLGSVTLLCSFLEHKSGIQWILATTYWNDVMQLGREAHTMYIRKKAYEFVAKLLEKTMSFNRTICFSIIDMLVRPLRDAFKILSKNNTAVSPGSIEIGTLFETLKPNLIFISEVMEILLKAMQTTVLDLFIELKTGELSSKLLLLSHIEDFSFELIKIRFILLFARMGKEPSPQKTDAIKTVSQDSTTLFDIKTMFDMIQDEMDKDHVRCVIKICHYAHTLYCSLAGKMPLCIRKGEPIEFQNQMVLFQIMPIMLFLSDNKGMSIDVWMNDVFRRDFVQRLVKMSAIRTVEICFRWKQRLLVKPDLLEDMTFGLQYMRKSKKLLDKEKAVLFFQPLVYSFRDILCVMETKNCSTVTPSYTAFMQTLIETIIDLVETFELTWQDCIETISVMRIACEFLQYDFLGQKLVVSGLRLLNLAISKYMSPDMVLLMDNCKDSVVSYTGSLLYSKCLDLSWEIRDTALENIHTLSLNAISKFPSFVNILTEADLPRLVVQMAFKDSEYYVRATAFRCLQELIQIEVVWDIFMGIDKFLESTLDMLLTETEGVVRKEVATLVSKISEHQEFPEDMRPRLYDVMTHAALGDLHWEVKCNALDFWININKVHLSNLGMIDCSFPTVTFSREQRKIITLNESEIRKGLIKMLNQLSHTGCLYVVKHACLDDCDVEVFRKARTGLPKAVALFKKYNVPCENIDISEPFSPCSSTTWSVPSPECADPQSRQLSQFDPVSPFSVPLSPSSNIDLLSDSGLLSCNPSSQVALPTISPIHHQSTADDDVGSATQTRMLNNFDFPKDDGGNGSILNDGHLCSSSDNLKEESTFDAQKTESILDEILNSNDMSFLQRIYNPNEEVNTPVVGMRRKTYLAPSEYIKFIYNEVDSHTTEKTEWPDSLDEFSSLLDDILKEYNVTDVNQMDCY